MFKFIASIVAFFKRQDQFARADLESEVAALKRQIAALKGQITKLSAKPTKGRGGK